MRSKVADRILSKTPEETKIFVKLYADLIVRINELLKENDLTQSGLAQKMNKKPSEISKWLNGEHNLTLRSIAKLQAELGSVIIQIPSSKHRTFKLVKSEKFHLSVDKQENVKHGIYFQTKNYKKVETEENFESNETAAA